MGRHSSAYQGFVGCAVAIVDEVGIEALVMRELAHRTHYSVSTVSYHVTPWSTFLTEVWSAARVAFVDQVVPPPPVDEAWFGTMAERSGIREDLLVALEHGGAVPSLRAVWHLATALRVPRIDDLHQRMAYLTAELASASRHDTTMVAALREHERIVGHAEVSPESIWHHRRSMYGVRCRRCSRPLRTPSASRCAACGLRVDAV